MSHERLRAKFTGRVHRLPGAPGYLLRDDGGNLHIDVPAFLREMNVVDTPENRDEAMRVCAEVARELFPTTEVIETL